LAVQLGASVVVHHLPSRFGTIWLQMPGRFFPIPFPRNQDSGYRRWLESQYQEYQASTPVKLCIENMPAYRRFGRRWNLWHWNTLPEILRFPNLTMDTTHLGTWSLEPAEVYPQLGSQVSHIHLSNYDNEEHLRPETGQLHLDQLLKHLVQTQYAGDITLELHPGVLAAGQPDHLIIEKMATSLAHCRKWAS
jgi:sugar phosphate isomerase/epimerase